MSSHAIFRKRDELSPHFLNTCRVMPFPTALLMCPPDHYTVCDVKNPHMERNVGRVDAKLARAQWDSVVEAFRRAGATVERIDPTPGCEDMVFCANQTLVGLDADGRKVCLLSRMKHPSRQREVEAFSHWFAVRGYRVARLAQAVLFEGSGDAIWHPGRGLIWGGSGFRTDSNVYDEVSSLFGVPVIHLPLRSERFYHLDTCFCPLDEQTVLVHPGSLTADAMELIRAIFPNVIECDDVEANEGMACNATALAGRQVVIQAGNRKTTAALRAHGYRVDEVDTSEYLKSGGSVFCMKMHIF